MPQQAVNRVIHLRVGGDLGQVATHQGEVVTGIQLADAADAIQRAFVPYMAAQRIGRVGGVDHHPALAHDVRGVADQARLRVVGVYLVELAQLAASSAGRISATGQRSHTPRRPSSRGNSTPGWGL